MESPRPLILVVEDNALIRWSAVDIAEEAGFEALQAADADSAIRILEGRPDIRLVFTDIEMPGSMNGIKLAHYVRNSWPPIKFLVVLGKVTIKEGQLPEGAAFFPKPYDHHQIANALRRMLL